MFGDTRLRRWFGFVLLLGALAASRLAPSAATVTGTIYAADGDLFTGDMLFRTLRTPLVSGSTLVTGGDYRVALTNGALSTTLLAGDYRAFIGADQKGFIIAVPSGTNSFSILGLITNSITYTDQTYPWESTPPATSTTGGTVKTDVDAGDPVVYLKSSIDALLATNSAPSKLDITNGTAVNLTGVLAGVRLDGTTLYGGDGSNNLTANTLFNLGLRGVNGETVSVYPTAHTTKNSAILVALDTSLVTTNASVEVRGYYEPGDGGGGTFYYAPFEATNRGTVFQAGSASFVWKRVIPPGGINPRMFGAKGNFNATTVPTGDDDTAALQAMIDYSADTGTPISGWPGNYQVTSTLTVPDNFGSKIDFGGASISGDTIYYVNATNTPFLTLLDPSRFEICNLALYFKPENGWGLSDAASQAQQNTNAYVFRSVGWGTFMNIHDISAFYGSGFIVSNFDTNLVSRSEARLFNNNIETVTCRYGYAAIDHNAGSGSTWNNLYLNASSGGTTNMTAQSAIVSRSFMNNEVFNRVNIEWSGFTGEMLALTNAEVQFNGLHVEGVNFPTNGNSIRWASAISGGSVTFQDSRIQDLRPAWGSITKFGLFSIVGSPVTTLSINNSILERFTESPDPTLYTFHRYLDYSGGASYIQVNGLNERDVGWWTNSPSWYGFDERPLLSAKRAESRSDFLNGLNGWSVSYAGTPTAYSYITSPTNAPGVIRINTGMTSLHATVMQLPYAGTYTGGAVQRMKVRFKLPAIPSSSSDDMRLRIGFMNDVSGSPGTDPTDGVFLYMSRTSYGDNRIALMGSASSSTSSSTLVTSASMVAGEWYEAELIINNDGTQTRAFLNPRTSANAANVTATIPTATTALFPTVQFIKRGASAVTNFQLDLDQIDVLIAPNGIY